MRCFNHPTHEASGICRHCGRALCSDCIVFAEEAVACRGHESRVAAIQRTIQQNPLSYRTVAGQMRQAGIYSLFVGLLFATMGGIFLSFVGDDFGHYLGAIFIGLGMLIFVRGASSMWASRQYTQLAIGASDQAVTPATDRYQ